VIVVDSSVWISHFADVLHPEVKQLRAIYEVETILVGDLILLEVLRGAQSDQKAARIAERLSFFDTAIMIDRAIATQAATNYRRLRSLGITIRNSIDLIIGTYCIEHGHRLLHRDRDFRHMRQLGLQIYAS